MRVWGYRVTVALICQALLVQLAWAASNPAFSSPNYQVVESDLGANGDMKGTSSNFSFDSATRDGGSTLGDIGVGNSSSANFQTGAGFNTTSAPGLTLMVNTSNANFGTLSSSLKSTATAAFSVINYTSYGYVVQLVGTPPSNSGNPLDAMTTTSYGDASTAGAEQFGVNLVLNNITPVGANPVQVPSSAFGFGVAGDGVTGVFGSTRPYTVPERWRFVSGETVASAPKSSGQTNYTMTLLANISTASPGGIYSGALSIVVTGTY